MTIGAAAVWADGTVGCRELGGPVRFGVNGQWRICFVRRDGNAHRVEMVDYHDHHACAELLETAPVGLSRG